MIIETSVLIAILYQEPEADAFMEAIDRDAIRLISVCSVLEALTVVRGRHGDAGEERMDAFLRCMEVIKIPFDGMQLVYACEATRKFGRSSKAKLNFGDCISYGLSRAEAEPLLFKGNDFWHTDVEIHPASARANK